MSKKELTKKLMNRMQKFGYFPTFTNVKTFIKEYEKLAKPEPQKPVVPQFVADWIERRRKRGEYSLLDAMHLTAQSEDFRKWIMSSKHQEVFARAWLDGYEVEKEKRYLVKIKSTGQCLGKYYINNETLSPRFIYTGRNADGFTRKELEDAGFGEVFNSPLFEVEEVEDDFKI